MLRHVCLSIEIVDIKANLLMTSQIWFVLTWDWPYILNANRTGDMSNLDVYLEGLQTDFSDQTIVSQRRVSYEWVAAWLAIQAPQQIQIL